MDTSKKQKIIVIEGNIGVGKSSLLGKLLAEFPEKYEVFLEPKYIWRDFHQKNYLEASYNSTKHDLNIEKFQILVLATMLERMTNIAQDSLKNSKTIVIERSIWAALNFINTNSFYNSLDSEFSHLLKYLTRSIARFVDQRFLFHYIFLTCDTGINLTRVQKRARPEEEKISFKYLDHLKHEHTAQAYILKIDKVPIIEIDTTQLSPIEVLDRVEEAINTWISTSASP